MATAIALIPLNLKALKHKRDWHDGAEYKLVWAGRSSQTHSDYAEGAEIGEINFGASETVWITTKDGKKVLVDANNVDVNPESI